VVQSPAVAFQLSSHEVMRGIKVRDGKLVLRPWGWYFAGSYLDVPVALALLWWAVWAGGFWLLSVPFLVWMAIESAARARVAVFATPTKVTVRNRFRTHRVDVSDVSRVRTEIVEWTLRQPVNLFMRASLTGREWQIGVIDVGGRLIECDALVSMPPSQGQMDPTAAAMKAATLHRWVTAHLAAGA
jgi:hypothetical protein